MRLWFPDFYYYTFLWHQNTASLLLPSPSRYTGVSEHVIIDNIHPLSVSARISARVPPCTHTSVLGTRRSHTFLPLSLAPIPSNPREGPRDMGPPPH